MSARMLLDRFKVAKNQYPTSERIELWRRVYKGNPDWLSYEYATLTGVIQNRRRKSMQAAKLLCAELTGLMYSEFPSFNTDDDILKIFEASGYKKQLPSWSERGIALGGCALKIISENGELFLDYIPAERFIPVSWDSVGVYEADFLDKKVINEKTYVRIERHRRTETGYNIINEAYELLDGGTLVPKSLMVLGGAFKETVDVPIQNPLFVYVKLPEANNLEDDSPLGISVFANALDTLESLDIAFDALRSEIVLGRKRIIVPASAVRSIIDTETGKALRYFDPSDEVFQAFSTDDKDQLKITDASVELRIDEIRLAIQTLLDILSVQLGFSAGYLTFDGQAGIKTATEVVSENSKTFKTKKAIENAFGEALLSIIKTLKEIGPSYGLVVSANESSIEWEDSIIEDRNSAAAYWQSRLMAGTALLSDVLMHLDGLDEEQAISKAALINAEKKTVDVSAIFGGGA